MNTDQITDLIRYTLYTALEISAPLLVISMVIGLIISIFQAVTQITEMTLTFVPKMIVFAFSLVIFFPWILKTTIVYTNYILITQWNRITEFTQMAQ